MINKVIRTYKIKASFNDEQKQIIFRWMDECDRVYNKCVSLYNIKNHTNLMP